MVIVTACVLRYLNRLRQIPEINDDHRNTVETRRRKKGCFTEPFGN